MQTTLFPQQKKRGAKSLTHVKPPRTGEANRLAKQIEAYLNSKPQCVCYRISYGVHVDDKGRKRATGQTPGLPDLMAIVSGRAVGIEIKIGTDRLSDVQKQRKAEFEASQGLFWEVKEWKDFINHLNQLLA